MPRYDIDLNPTTRIITNALGEPGKRVFYLQGEKADQTITLLIEKNQLQTLAVGAEQFLAEIAGKFPDLPEAGAEFDEENMLLSEPLEPLFRVGEMGLGYDVENDLIILVARELNENLDELLDAEKENGGDTSVVRFWITRTQLRSLIHWGIILANRGRPICPQCGEPMDPAGHFCPKKNGHKH